MDKDYYIMIVDDVKFNRMGMMNILNLINCFSVVEAENGKEAVDLFAQKAIKNIYIDYIFIDIQMPVMNGY